MDILDLSRIFFALIAVLGLIGLCAMIAKKVGFVSGAVGLAKKRRLQIIETLPLDARRRAAIISCDGREHLVILGQTSETLVEANIPATARLAAEESHAANSDHSGEAGSRGAQVPSFARTTGAEGAKPLNFAEAFARLNLFARNPYQPRIKDEQKAA